MRSTLPIATLLALAACVEQPPTAPSAAARTLGARAASPSIVDAAERVAPSLADPAVGEELQRGLRALAAALAAADGDRATRELSAARAALARYSARAPLDDAPERDVIALALDATARDVARRR